MRNVVTRLALVTKLVLGFGALTSVVGLSAIYGAEAAEEPAGFAVGVGFFTIGSALMALGALAWIGSLRARASVRASEDPLT